VLTSDLTASSFTSASSMPVLVIVGHLLLQGCFVDLSICFDAVDAVDALILLQRERQV
jgi:hypothetical protein